MEEGRVRIWPTPSHVDVKLNESTWMTWELNCEVLMENKMYTLIDFYHNASGVLIGVFRINGEEATCRDVPLKQLGPPPPLKCIPVEQ